MRVKSRQTAVPFLVLCFVLAFAGAAFAAAFSDTGGHWAESRIAEWAQKGLVQGYPDGTFRPDGEVTRAEFVALTNRAFGVVKAGAAEAGFADVKPGDWFYEDVMAAKAAGYIAGYPDGTFMPDRNITRQEAAVILARLLGLQPDAGRAAGFADGGAVGAWAAGSVGAVAKAGLMVGMPDGTFMPLKGTTRAEAVVLLDRAVAYRPAGAIEGSVTLNGSAASGASVRVFAAGGYEVLKEAVTGSDGKFKVELPPGEYDVTAAAAADVAFAGGVKVASSRATGVSLALQPAAVISGVLKDRDGSSAVKNTAVLFTANPTFAARTDGEGKFTVPVLPNRTYTVRAYDPGKKGAAPEVVKTGLEVGPAGKYDIGTLNAPFEVSAVSGGGGGGGGPSGPIVLTVISAGEYKDPRGYKIASFGTFGPASGTATFTSKLIIDPGDAGTLTLRNISAGEIEVLSGGKSFVHTQNVNAGRLVASASGGVKIEAGEGTVITTTEVQGETHIAVAPGASASFGAITIKSGAAGKTVAFSGDLSGSTVTVAAGSVTLQADSGAQMGRVVIDAPGEINLTGAGSFGEIEVSENAGQGGTPVINVAAGTGVDKLVLSTTVELKGDGIINVPLEVTDPDKVQIIVNDPNTKEALKDKAIAYAVSAISAIPPSITLNNEADVGSARNRVNAVQVLKDKGENLGDLISNLGKLEDAESVISALKSIDVGFASGDSAAGVTKNLTLPGTAGGLAVDWQSSDTAVITACGAVTRQETDRQVKLTATVTKGSITGTREFTLTVKAVPPEIISFAGEAPDAGNVITVPLANITTTTGIEVSRDCSLALNMEGMGAVRQFDLEAGKVNSIYNILIPGAGEVDLSGLDLNKLADAAGQCPPDTREDILDAVDFAALFDLLSGNPEVKSRIIDETDLDGLMDQIVGDPGVDLDAVFDAFDFAGVLNAVRDDGSITSDDIMDAVNFDELAEIINNLADQQLKDRILDAIDIDKLLDADTKEELYAAVNFSALFEALSDVDELVKDDIFRTINFTALFDMLSGADAGTVEAVFGAVNFTSLFEAVAGAGDDTVSAVVEAALQMADIMRDCGISRNDILDTIDFSSLNKESLYEWLSEVDGDGSALTLEAVLTDSAGNTSTYTINIVKQ